MLLASCILDLLPDLPVHPALLRNPESFSAQQHSAHKHTQMQAATHAGEHASAHKNTHINAGSHTRTQARKCAHVGWNTRALSLHRPAPPAPRRRPAHPPTSASHRMPFSASSGDILARVWLNCLRTVDPVQPGFSCGQWAREHSGFFRMLCDADHSCAHACARVQTCAAKANTWCGRGLQAPPGQGTCAHACACVSACARARVGVRVPQKQTLCTGQGELQASVQITSPCVAACVCVCVCVCARAPCKPMPTQTRGCRSQHAQPVCPQGASTAPGVLACCHDTLSKRRKGEGWHCALRSVHETRGHAMLCTLW